MKNDDPSHHPIDYLIGQQAPDIPIPRALTGVWCERWVGSG